MRPFTIRRPFIVGTVGCCQFCANKRRERREKALAGQPSVVSDSSDRGADQNVAVYVSEPRSIVRDRSEVESKGEVKPDSGGVTEEVDRPGITVNSFPDREMMESNPKELLSVFHKGKYYTLYPSLGLGVDGHEDEKENQVWWCWELYSYLKLRVYLRERTTELLQSLFRRAIIWCEEASIESHEAIGFVLPTVVRAFELSAQEASAVVELSSVQGLDTAVVMDNFNKGLNPHWPSEGMWTSIFRGRFFDWRAKSIYAYQNGVDGYIASK